MAIGMYGEHHLREIDDVITRVVEEKLIPFSAAARRWLNGAKVDRDTAHLNELAENTGRIAPAALALHFRYIGCKPNTGRLSRLMALRASGSYVDKNERFLGQAMAEIVESVSREKIPAAMLQARMRLVAMMARSKKEDEDE